MDMPGWPAGYSHHAVESHLVFVAEARAGGYDLLHFENSSNLPHDDLINDLGANKTTVLIKICPSDLGWPATGKRTLKRHTAIVFAHEKHAE